MICVMAKILYINAAISEEEEEAKVDETQPASVPKPKIPLGKLLYRLRDND